MTRVVRVYRSTDGSAPVLDNASNAMVNLLDKCLVAGYGSATAAGWTKPFTGTNKAAFRNDTTDGSGVYYRVDDAAVNSGRNAYVQMYETMSDVDTGTNAAPTNSTHESFRKTATADATARPWVVVADNCAAWVMIQSGDNGTEWVPHFIGDIFSYKTSDAYRGFLLAAYSPSGVTVQNHTTALVQHNGGPGNGASTGRYVVRKHDGAGSAQECGLHFNVMHGISNPSGAYYPGSTSFVLPYPDALTNGLLMTPMWVHQTTTSPYVTRGYLPGVWAPMHNRPIANNDTFSGVGALASKTFEAFNIYLSGQMMLETSNTWS